MPPGEGKGKKATLVSPIFPSKRESCLSFELYITGVDAGKLEVFLSSAFTGDTKLWSYAPAPVESFQQGMYTLGKVPLTYPDTFQVRLIVFSMFCSHGVVTSSLSE